VIPPERTARLGLRLKRLPDHRRLWVLLRRESAEHPAPACAVYASPPNSSRRGEWNLGHAGERGPSKLLENGGSDAPALGVATEAARLVVTQVYAGNDIRRPTDKPHVGRTRSGARLSKHRPVKVAQNRGSAPLDYASKDMHHLERSHRL
jgi:hypothetical protein